ncbi:glycine-rich RNA-binding protein GRP2A-like [Miscanthus floridulus]|uniref:glycine-rich RNA-binding protein GRP2A-like n=1 Tax=Miscanthus floridulus TaxID=154761 RepID=UPI003458995C
MRAFQSRSARGGGRRSRRRWRAGARRGALRACVVGVRGQDIGGRAWGAESLRRRRAGAGRRGPGAGRREPASSARGGGRQGPGAGRRAPRAGVGGRGTGGGAGSVGSGGNPRQPDGVGGRRPPRR